MRLIATLLLASLLLTTAATLRPPEYDEAYSIFLTAGDPRPQWPDGIFRPSDTRQFYRGNPSLAQIAAALQQTDVHPPLYFWALKFWRHAFGPAWLTARLLSVLFSIAGLACLARLADLADIPATPAILLALLAYGFAYTGIVARGFALAQALNILGMTLILSAAHKSGRSWHLAFAGGLVFGAACFSNYLAVFIAFGAFFWVLLHPKQLIILPPAILGFAVFLPPAFSFFLAQHNSRIGQFQPFSAGHAIALLAKDAGAALYGGLPIYAGSAGIFVSILLAGITLLSGCFIIANWRVPFSLFATAVAAMPAGLLALGLIFNNTPIEIRYLSFASPYLALLLAAALPGPLRLVLLGLEAAGFLGLVAAPATMQPQALAARQIASLNLPSALVLVPFGNDGVGIPGPFIATAPGNLQLQLIKPGSQPDLSLTNSIILATLQLDASSTASTRQLLAMLAQDPCWKQLRASQTLALFTRRCEQH